MMGKFLSVQNITFCAAKRQRSILKFEMTLSHSTWHIFAQSHIRLFVTTRFSLIASKFAKVDLKFCQILINPSKIAERVINEFEIAIF